MTALALIFFQMLGLVIPLLTLPLLSSALGVPGFGQVMTAQAVMLLAVVWVDAGFNVQSQQAAARDIAAELALPQALLDNLLARSLAALKAGCVVMLTPLLLPEISFRLLLASLPLLLGTLLFPQWWLLATGRGFSMGLVTVVGRLMSAFFVWWWVHDEQDGWLAALAMSIGTLLSGLLVVSVWLIPLYRHRQRLSWSSWRHYVRLIKPLLLPAFCATACAQLPVVALGAYAGALQTGLFSAADRLTRAGGHLLSLIEQSLVTQWLQPLAAQHDRLNKMRQRILYIVPCALGVALTLAWFLAPWVIHFLYNDRFMGAVAILRVLLIWVFLQTIRRLLVALYWLIDGQIQQQAGIQWVEFFLYGLLVLSIVALTGIDFANAWGLVAAYGLCMIELGLMAYYFWLNKRRLSVADVR
jgi:O-antigen/teichoic acid export membrane protein